MDAIHEDKRQPARSLAVTASIATLAVPVLYIVGYGYDLGYLAEFGVSTEFFPRSVQEYLVLAFYALLYFAISTYDAAQEQWHVILIMATITAGATLIAIAIHESRLSRRLQDLAVAARRHKSFDYVAYPTLVWTLSAVIPYALVATLFLVLFAPSVGYFKGRAVAREGIDGAAECLAWNPSAESCIRIRDGDKTVLQGRFVARSETHVAVYDGSTTIILPLREYIVDAAPRKGVSSRKSSSK